MNRKIYLDCTHTYNSGLNTGIQRTVRNIVYNIDSEIYPNVFLVFYYNDNFYKISNFSNIVITSNQNRYKIVLKKIYKFIRNIFSIIPPIKKLMLNPKFILFLDMIYDRFYQKQIVIENEKIYFNKDDALVLLDSAWSNINLEYLKNLKNRDILIIPFIYDLIPMYYPNYCSEDLVSIYNYWIKNIVPISNKFISISRCVENELIFTFNLKREKIDYNYLGANFKNPNFDEKQLEINYKKLFKDNNTFITVSTIEPRKNHEYILNAFEKLWEKNKNVKYIIIGRIGWKVDKLIKRIKNHKEFNKRLFFLENIDDNHLVYAYKNSKALIFASFAEGFGLPIIESLHNKLQVLASDIEIHREIGKEYISYFDLNDINSLVSLIEKDEFKKNLDNFKWISWEESTNQLITKVLNIK